MKPPRPKVAWSHGDRFLGIILGLVLTLVVSLALWFRALDTNPVVSVPAPALPAPNAFTYYIAAREALVETNKADWAASSLPPAKKPVGFQRPLSLAEKEVLVRENAGAIQILHMGFRYPCQEPPTRSFRVASAHDTYYTQERGLARFLAFEAQVQAERGDWNAAINANLDAIQVGETMPRGGALMAMLTGAACQSIGRRHAWEVVDHLTAVQAKAAARRLEGIRAGHVPFADTMQEDEWLEQASLLELMRQHDWPANLGYYSGAEADGTVAAMQQKATLLRIRLTGKRTIMANYTRHMDQVLVNARQPYAAHLADPPIPSDPVSQIFFPANIGLHLDEAKAATQNALLLTLLALRAYKLDHGAYPAALSALAPGYLKSVPDDPFALSGPLRYKGLGSKFLLYSVGPDGQDDGGKPIFDPSKSAPTRPGALDQRYNSIQPGSQGDIVAGVNIFLY